MANELPYFRFTVQAWQNGKIDIERNELKGLFISICGYYWIQDCSITIALLKKKFSSDLTLIDELIDAGVLKVKREIVEITFLNDQYDLLSEKRKARQAAGSKGGNAKAMLKQKPSYKDNNKDKDKDNNKIEVLQSVFLTQAEIDKLSLHFSDPNNAIEILSNYKLSSGKKYKSDYHALVGWVKDKITKEEKLNKTSNTKTHDTIRAITEIAESLRNNTDEGIPSVNLE